MSPYETLGVPSDASQDEIKRAYRRKVSANHPDRGALAGSESMAEINRAYEVLSDPERRKRFDAGENLDEKSLEVEARDMLLGALAQSIDGVLVLDPIAAVQGVLNALQTGLQQHASTARSTIKRLELLNGRIKVKMGENLAQSMIQQRLSDARKQLQTIERGQKVRALAAVMLLNYSFDAPVTHAQTNPYPSNMSSSGGNAFNAYLGAGFWR